MVYEEKDADYDVGVIGLGYVGLTLATALADVGMRVVGIEIRDDVVDLVNSGKAHFSETGLNDHLSNVTRSGNLRALTDFEPGTTCGVYIITVGTPLDKDGLPRLDFIRNATRQVGAAMPDGALVIVRSTVKVGTTREIVSPILAETGKSFHIAMCPERTLEGEAMKELRSLPQIVGADEEETIKMATRFFSELTPTIIKMSSLETAEITKLVDNTYRDVKFAFANEVARACEAYGVNAMEVISNGKIGYKRTDVSLPGLVGGPCLEKDPHIFNHSVKERGITLEITGAARLVNERQPIETVAFIAEQLKTRTTLDKARVAVLGLAFKGYPETDDLRGSMALHILRELKKYPVGAGTVLYDPVISYEMMQREFPDYEIARSVSEAIAGANVVIIANNHADLGRMAPAVMVPHMADDGFVYDYWNHFSNLSEAELDQFYFSLGNVRGAR